MTEHLIVPDERAGIELDEFLCLQFPFLAKGRLRGFVRDGLVLLDGTRVLPAKRLRAGQVVSCEFDTDEGGLVPVAPARPLELLTEEAEWLAVDKPPGLAVEPERWDHDAASVSGGLLELALRRSAGGGVELAESGPAGERSATAGSSSAASDAEMPREAHASSETHASSDEADASDVARTTLDLRLRPVHRIDKDTTGILLVAKSIEAERYLRRAFQESLVHKEYLALVEGEYFFPDGDEDWIDAPLAPDPRRVGRMRVRSKGKPSRTRVRVAQAFRGYTLLSCFPETGRTHQIRVHLAHAGYPLAVDPLYGRRDALLLSEIKRGYRPKPGRAEKPLMDRLTLHAAALEFPFRPGAEVPAADDPTCRVEAPLPKDFARVLTQLAKARPRTR